MSEKKEKYLLERFKSVTPASWQLVIVCFGLTLLLLGLIAGHSLVLGYAKEWAWLGANEHLGSGKIIYFFFALLFIAFVYLFVKKNIVKSQWLFLALALIFGYSLIIILFSLYPEGLGRLTRIVSDKQAFSFYLDSFSITNLNQFLKNYIEGLPALSVHSQVHPPGGISLCYLLRFLGDKINLDPALFVGLVVPFLGLLTIFPLYFLSKELSSVYAAKIAVIFYLLVPSALFFVPELDQMYPLLFTSVIALYLLGMRRDKAVYFLLGGLILALGFFFSFLFIVIPLPIFIIWLIYYWQKDKAVASFFQIKKFLKYNLIFLFGFLIFWLIYQVAFGYNIYNLYQAAMLYHGNFLAERTYSIWVFMNLFDFFLFFGIPFTIIFLFAMGKEFFLCFKQKKMDVIFWLFLLTILFLDLMGKNRSETARVWLFLAPLGIIPVAKYVSEGKNKNFIFFAAIVFLLLQILIFRKFVQVIWF